MEYDGLFSASRSPQVVPHTATEFGAGEVEKSLLLKRRNSWSPHRPSKGTPEDIPQNVEDSKMTTQILRTHHRCASDGCLRQTENQLLSEQAEIVGSWTTASIASEDSSDEEDQLADALAVVEMEDNISAARLEMMRPRTASVSSSSSSSSSAMNDSSSGGSSADISSAALVLSESEVDCEEHLQPDPYASEMAAKRLRSRVTSGRTRRAYLERLGIEEKRRRGMARKASLQAGPQTLIQHARVTMGTHARRASQASARARRMPKVTEPLKAPQKSGFKRSLVNAITHWIVGSDEREANKSEFLNGRVEEEASKSVNFRDTTDVFFIPTRKEIPPQVKRQLWPTRQEFMTMVMRNVEEMDRESQQASQSVEAAFPCED